MNTLNLGGKSGYGPCQICTHSIYVEVPGPEVEVPIYVEVPVDPPQTTFVGEMNENNTIRGSIHDDVIIGGHLNDVLRGAKGNDYIVTHEGLDKVRGGDGQDTFVLSVGEGFTRLKDYNPLEDTIVLPSDDYTLIEGLYTTKLYVGDDLVARINGFHTTIMWVHWYIKNKLEVLAASSFFVFRGSYV